MKHMNYTDSIVMFTIMIVSGLLSTMNVWVDKWEHIGFSINDIYMTFLMTGWSFLLMGLYYSKLDILCLGFFVVVINIWFIRTQFMVSNEQYILGMIPHHSMAIHMSKQLLQNKQPVSKEFVSNIIETQEKEIKYMKRMYSRLTESV